MAGKYRYERRLGGGGMAEVFLASVVGTQGFQRPVAIKRVLPSFSDDPEFARMFVNEARISAMLRHPNIVQVLDFDRDDDRRLFLVMELVEGKDLADLAKSGPLPVPVVVHVIAEVLEGLAHAHEATTPEGRPLGLVHRDISPHNVLLSWDGTVKVSDFGIAKAMLASGVAASGLVKGKPLYMAPEQVTSPDRVDQRADLFAVGVIMFELLTGRRVYQGATNEEVLTDVIQVARGWRQIVAPNVVRPELPWDVAQVAAMLLAADRDQRFASARDALDALLSTKSAPTRGASMLAELLAARFPAEAPRRRRSAEQRADAPTVVAEDVQEVMQAATRTVEARPSARRRARPAPRRSRVLLVVALSAIAAIAAAGVTILLTGDDRRGAAPATIDAAVAAPVAIDAAPAAIDARPPDAAPPVDAAPEPDARRRTRRPRVEPRPPIDAAPPPEPTVNPACPDVPCDYDRDCVPDCR